MCLRPLHIFAVGLSFGCALGAPAALHAEDSTPLPAPQGWIVTLRANGGFAPNYEGSKDISPYVLPGLGMRRPNSIVGFSTPDEAPGFTLFDNGWLRGGLNGQVRGPRHQSDYRELNGIHDIDWQLEAGGFAETWLFEKLRAKVEFRHGFLGHHGNRADFFLDWVEHHGAWTVSFGPRFTLGDAGYLNKLFGVSPYEALLNGKVTPYKPAGGAKSVGLAGAVDYQWNENWSTTLSTKYNWLVAEAAKSPIVRNLGSSKQFSIGLSVSYSFHWDAPF